jgi:hypothetical protein
MRKHRLRSPAGSHPVKVALPLKLSAKLADIFLIFHGNQQSERFFDGSFLVLKPETARASSIKSSSITMFVLIYPSGCVSFELNVHITSQKRPDFPPVPM